MSAEDFPQPGNAPTEVKARKQAAVKVSESGSVQPGRKEHDTFRGRRGERNERTLIPGAQALGRQDGAGWGELLFRVNAPLCLTMEILRERGSRRERFRFAVRTKAWFFCGTQAAREQVVVFLRGCFHWIRALRSLGVSRRSAASGVARPEPREKGHPCGMAFSLGSGDLIGSRYG